MKEKYDIIVMGAGPAGIAAAISARRLGASVLLIERDGVPGGMSTSGMLYNWCGDADSALYRKIYAMSQPRRTGIRRLYNPEELKFAYFSLLDEAGVELLLHSFVCGAQREKDRLKSVKTATKKGICDLSADVFIDATGDGDAAYFAGLPFSIGRESDGKVQPSSLEFIVSGVDDGRAVFAGAGRDKELIKANKEFIEKGRLDGQVGWILLAEGYEKGTAFVNMTNALDIDGTDSESLTKAEKTMHAQIPQIIAFLRECVPGYENCRLLVSAPYSGVRETRRFKGEYTVTEEDVQSGRSFENRITNGVYYVFGVHNPDGPFAPNPTPENKGNYYTIPYGAIVPVGIENLLLAGRCISGTHMAHASYRAMPICIATGEGAGLCAAIAVRDLCDAGRLSEKQIKEVQAML